MKPRRLLAFAASITVVLTVSAHAVDVIKANNTNNLNLGTSWSGGTGPTSSDVAVWNNTVVGANVSALGGSVSWQGIRIANNAGGAVTITGTSGATLTLGSAGIDMSSANQNLTIGSPTSGQSSVPVILSASQTWNIGTGRTLTYAANNGSATSIDLNGATLGTSGAGNIVINNKVSLASATAAIINVNNTSFSFESGSSATVSIASNITTNVASARVFQLRGNSGAGGVGINSNGLVNVNGGIFRIASSSGVAVNQTAKVSLANGSTLDNTVSTAGAQFNLSGELAVAGSTTWNESGANANTASTFSGPLTGNGTLDFKNTSGVAGRRSDWSGNNSGFTGTVNINGSSGNRNLRLTTATAGSSSATWAPAAGNVLEVNGVAVNLGTLNGAGTVTNSHATNVAGITVGAGAFSGAITNGTPLLGMALTKIGSGTLALSGANTYTGLTDVQGGTLSTTTLQTGGGAVTVGDTGTFAMTQSANGSTFNISTLTLGSAGGSKLDLTSAAAPSAALITASNFTVNGSNSITLKGTPVNNTTLIDYTGSIGGSGFGGLSLFLPFRTSGTLFHDTTNTLVQLTSFAADTLKWQGNVNSAWDIDTTNTGAPSGATANWKTTAAPGGAYYVQAGAGLVDSPVFDDTATGSTAVTLATTVTPVGITFNNSSLAYSISGAGAIAGTTSIVKNGTAALTLATNNSFNGGVQLSAGTLNVNNNGALGTGTLAIAAGTTLDNTSGSAKVATNAQNWNGNFTFTGSSDLSLGTAALNADRQVTVNANTLSVGGITGGFGLTKAGGGTLSVGASSYNGATTVNGGTLKATSTTSFTTTSSLTLANTAGVTLDLNGNSQTISNLTGGGTTGGNVVLGGATLTTGIATDTTLGGLSGAGGLVKSNAGRLSILGDKSGYTGTTTINAGVLDVGTVSGGFGTTLNINNGSVIQANGSLTGSLGTGNQIVAGNGGFAARGGNLTVNLFGDARTIQMTGSGNTFGNGLVLGSSTADSRVIFQNGLGINNFNATRTITVNSGTGTDSAEISGIVSNGNAGGDNGINKTGNGDLILSAANTITGSTTIGAGRIVLGHNQALQFTSLNTDNAGRVGATGFTTPTIGGLTGSTALGTFINSGYSGITTLTLAPQTGRSPSYSGVIADGAVGMNLVKSGAGTQTLNGVNTYTGSTTINGGTLALGAAGSIDDSTGVSLGTNGTFDVSAKVGGYSVDNLSGSGDVIGSLTVSTQLSAGNSPGTIDVSGNLSLGALSTYTYEMTGGGITADLVNVGGTLTINSGSILDLVELGTYTVGNKFTLFGYNTGITGTFSGLLDDSNFLDDLNNEWSINYNDATAGLNGGTGSSFVTITAVPEPGAALLGGLGVLALLGRRRR